ncbi:right-handed parallel beta-helix repeat-containing protein [Cohnella fermenti]|uniref:BIG2 domain-containing protein n=1 Tax=Cohnella fermenti TaxID=2565925 RepID=A0A4S4C835_9BACL|nr:right-handed parallel beta-helix repeat-containing protein [Cohnella fermenti]THF84163.1 hypothetical protein E6C55_02360 [Cohnella fermenti]
MRKGFMIGLALTLLAGNASLQPQVRAEESVPAYYVSLQGDESGDGSIGSPFPSLTAARNAVRAATASGMTEDIVVYVRGGDYYLPETLAFSEQDSGKDGHTITYRNYPGESPVLHGGQLLTGWQSVGDGLYRVDAQQLRFNTLYENGERSIKARYPNKGAVREGYLQIAEAAAAGDKNRFRFGSGDIPSIANLTDLEVYVWSGTGISWDSDTLGVQSVDYSSRLVTLESSAKYELGQGARYYVQGALELLDEPGEFYLDSTADQLYYRPRSLPIGNQSIVAPTTDRLIQFKGSSQTTPVANIRLQGLTLADSDFHADSPSGLVYLENAESIELADNEIRNSGSHAVYLFGWNQNHTLTGNSIHDIGYSGIQAQASSAWASRYYINKSNIISDNHIFRVGQLVGHGSGIQLIGSGDNEITHNRIHDTPRYAISMKGLPPKQTLERGTIEGKTVTAANVKDFNHSRNNLIAYNDISEANQDSMDTGMIEAWGAGLGNIIRYNRLHDSGIHFSFGFGIYLDDSTDDVTIDHNVIDHLQQSGDGSLYNPIRAKGYNNRIYDNVIADNPAAQRGAIGLSDNLGSASSQPSGQAGIARNILSNNGSTLYTFSDWSSSLVAEADYNLVYNGSGSYGIGGISGTTDFSQWQAYDNGRYDNHSEAADPLFLDAAQADYRLKVESPAYAIGISGIDTSVIGLSDAFVLGDPGESLDRLYLRPSPNDGRGYVEIAVNDSSGLALFARTATGYAADLSGDTVIYSSDHPEIASVDSSGIVTGESEGIALITAAVTRGEQTHTATLQAVVGDSLTGIHIRSPRNVLEIGESLAIQTVADSVLGYRGALPNSQIAYSSQQPSVLTATSAGILTAVGEGQSVVTAVYASGGLTYTATALVTVLPSKLARISLTAPTIMTEGETAAFTLTGQMSDGTTADLTGASIESQSVPSGVVSVQTTASSVTALAEGRTRVTLKVTLDGVSVNGFADIVVFPAQTELLPSPWALLNYPQVQGYAEWDPNVPVRLVSNGDNIWGASDSFSYLYRAASGNDEMKRTTISAVVHSLTPTDPDAAAGLMFRDGTDADADNVNVRIIPNGGLRMTYRSAKKPQSDYIMGPTVSFPAELRLVREGDTFIGSYKKDGNWKEFGRVSVAMTNTPAAGLTLFSRTALPAEASFGSIAYAQEDLVWSGLDVKASANRLWQVGQTTQISVQGITASETRIPLPGAAYAYASSNAGVLAVSSTGEATATGYGSATVSVSTEIGGQTIAGETVITVTQPRDGYDEIQAESADEVKGLVKYTTIIGGTTPQSWARYNDVDFGGIAPSLFEAKIAVPAQFAGKTVQVRKEEPAISTASDSMKPPIGPN